MAARRPIRLGPGGELYPEPGGMLSGSNGWPAEVLALADRAYSLILSRTAMTSPGSANLTLSKIVEFKIHDVTKAFIDEMVKLGFKDLTPDKIVELKIHDLTAKYIQDIRSAGLPGLTLDEALEFKIHDIDKEYVVYCREILKGKKELTPERVLSMKINEI